MLVIVTKEIRCLETSSTKVFHRTAAKELFIGTEIARINKRQSVRERGRRTTILVKINNRVFEDLGGPRRLKLKMVKNIFNFRQIFVLFRIQLSVIKILLPF